MVEVSETEANGPSSGADDSNMPARDHDGYHHRTHYFGDACPGGHLELTEDSLDELEQESIDDSREAERDTLEYRIERLRRDETFHYYHDVATPIQQLIRARRQAEAEAQRTEEVWEDDDPDAVL